MVRSVAVVLVVVAALCGAAGAQSGAKPQRARDMVAKLQTRFGLDMYSMLAQQSQTDNIFFSPVSIGTALAMAYAGSRESTAQQMNRVLGFQDHPRMAVLRGHRSLMNWMQKRYQSGGVTITTTNRIYTGDSLHMRKTFSSRVQRNFGAKMSQLDFTQLEQAAARINEDVKKDTRGHITDLMDPSTMSQNLLLVMVNAIYFKGTWLMQFNRSETAEADFHGLAGIKKVQMMKTKKQFPVGYVPSLEARALKLPYKGEDISMLILLPDEMDGIHQLDAKIETVDLEEVTWSLDGDDDVEVQLPRFKMQEKIDLKGTLKKMGLTEMFNETAANFEGISRREKIWISDAVHKAGIEVNEEGTTATAATALGFSFRMLKPKPEPFVVNRPFFFVLRDERTGATLFIGRVMKP